MLSDNQINCLLEFSKKFPHLKIGEAWCYDPASKILYSAVRESKLNTFHAVPSYKEFKIINGKLLKTIEIKTEV